MRKRSATLLWPMQRGCSAAWRQSRRMQRGRARQHRMPQRSWWTLSVELRPLRRRQMTCGGRLRASR